MIQIKKNKKSNHHVQRLLEHLKFFLLPRAITSINHKLVKNFQNIKMK